MYTGDWREPRNTAVNVARPRAENGVGAITQSQLLSQWTTVYLLRGERIKVSLIGGRKLSWIAHDIILDRGNKC
jgi:hypothetical protein